MKNFLKFLLSKLGLVIMKVDNLKKIRLSTIEAEHLKSWLALKHRQFDLILDVGANEGQFAIMIRKIFPETNLRLFEPLPDCMSKLESLRELLNPAQFYYYALGDKNSTTVMFANDFSPSSSILPMTNLHREIWEESKHDKKIEIKVCKLDDIWKIEKFSYYSKILLKIDVQGYEMNVLKGAKSVLKHIDTIVLEINFKNFYEGQCSFEVIHSFLSEHGFHFSGIMEQFFDSKDGSILFADICYMK